MPGRLAALAATLVVAGCSGPAVRDATPAASASAPTTSAPAPSATDRLEALYRARIDSSRTRFAEADVAFMTGMIGHHAQALVMAAMAPTHGANPEVRRLAARIDNAQRDEIATMQRWLRDRGQPAPEVHVMGTTLMVHGADGHADHAGMPGMLTDDQIRALDEARGAAFDRLFLSGMIQHHGGAVVMVDTLVATDGAAQDEEAFKLATDVQVDQRTEIARMQRMLDVLPVADPQP
jgi:uncharacterized protein (DUF305 family)